MMYLLCTVFSMMLVYPVLAVGKQADQAQNEKMSAGKEELNFFE